MSTTSRTQPLIFGAKEALLVDPPFTRTQIQAVGDWIERAGRRLAYIYATHGYGDHWFGTGNWLSASLGQIPETPVLAEAVPVQGFQLEGNPVVAVETGHTDTDKTSVLHVPSIGLVVAGDVAYNGVHQYILEGSGDGLQEWLRALDRVADLHPRAVVAGHKNKNRPDDPAILAETRQYLQDAIRLLDEKPTAREFYEQMTGLYPDRLNPGVVWLGARGLLGG